MQQFITQALDANCVLPGHLRLRLLQYLGTQPLSEVVELWNALQQLTPVPPSVNVITLQAPTTCEGETQDTEP